MVECDLRIPEMLHDYFNDYPLAPDRFTVSRDMLSPYQRELADKLKVCVGHPFVDDDVAVV